MSFKVLILTLVSCSLSYAEKPPYTFEVSHISGTENTKIMVYCKDMAYGVVVKDSDVYNNKLMDKITDFMGKKVYKETKGACSVSSGG